MATVTIVYIMGASHSQPKTPPGKNLQLYCYRYKLAFRRTRPRKLFDMSLGLEANKKTPNSRVNVNWANPVFAEGPNTVYYIFISMFMKSNMAEGLLQIVGFRSNSHLRYLPKSVTKISTTKDSRISSSIINTKPVSNSKDSLMHCMSEQGNREN